MKFKFRTEVSTNNSVVLGISLGIVAALIISLLLTTGMTSLVLGGKMNERLLQVFIFAIRSIALFVGVILGTALTREKYIAATGAITVGYMLLLMGLGIAVYDGTFCGFGSSVISIAVGAAVGYLFRLKLQNKPRRKKRISKPLKYG